MIMRFTPFIFKDLRCCALHLRLIRHGSLYAVNPELFCLRKSVIQIKRHGMSTQNSSRNASVVESKTNQSSAVTSGKKLKQASKDVYYATIIVIGVAVTGFMTYTIFRELFSSQSPNGIYSDALALCKANQRVVDSVGEPIKGYGELSSRGRRRHVSYVEFEQEGVKCMRMKFYIQGSRKKGTVHLEVRKNASGKYEYRYLFVELDDYRKETIILQDNRNLTSF